MIVEIADRLKTVEEYYFSKKLQEITMLEKSGIPILNLGIGKPDLVPADSIIKSLHHDSKSSTAHGYQAYKGISELRSTISRFYTRHFDVKCEPESEILPLIGSKEGVMHISMAFLNPGDEVLIPNPGYPTYANASKLAGATIKTYDLVEENNYQINIDSLSNLITDKTKIIWINYPHMPTGTKANREILVELVHWAKKNKILIASDTPYGFILNDKPFSILSIPGALDVCVELNSLSKSHGMSGWRIGMAISNKEVINAILRFKSNMDSGMFRPIQKAAITAMEIGDEWYRSNNEIYRKRREQIWNLLDRLGFHYKKDTAGLFVWSKISNKFQSGEEASDFLLEKARVFVPPGMIFGSNGDKYVRWSLCQPENIIKEAAEKIIGIAEY